MAACKSRLVAAITRTSVWMERVPPTRPRSPFRVTRIAHRKEFFFGVGTNEYGTDVESIDGNCVLGQILWGFGAIWTVGNAIRFVRPEVAEDLRQHSDVTESFHPISSIPPRHDEAQGEAVHHGQRLVIHGVGDHHLPIPCVVD